MKHSTMEESVEKQAVITAIDALSQFSVERNAAKYIKEVGEPLFEKNIVMR